MFKNSIRPIAALCIIVAVGNLGLASRSFGEEKKAEAQPPIGPVSLAQVLTLALERNPKLSEFSWDIRAAEARQIQARLRPNPELSVDVEDVGLGGGPATKSRQDSVGFSSDAVSAQTERSVDRGTGNGLSAAQFTLSLSQVIELGGKRAKRMQLAAKDVEVADWDYEVARADVLKETGLAFIAVVAAQEAVLLNEELVGIAQQVLETVTARVNAGRVSPLEASKAQTELATSKVQAEVSKRELEAARVSLAALWGEKDASFERAEGNLEDIRPIPTLEELRERVGKNPDVLRWQAETEKRRSTLALERATAKPDVTLMAGLRTRGVPDGSSRGFGVGSDGLTLSQGETSTSSGRENSVVLGLSVPLPLFSRNQGNILEAEHLAAKSEEQGRAAAIELNANLNKGYQNLSAASTTLLSLKNDILPVAKQTFESINSAYREGKFGYLDVLDAQHTLFQAQEEYLKALASYHENVAEIERTLGEPLWGAADSKPVEGGK